VQCRRYGRPGASRLWGIQFYRGTHSLKSSWLPRLKIHRDCCDLTKPESRGYSRGCGPLERGPPREKIRREIGEFGTPMAGAVVGCSSYFNLLMLYRKGSGAVPSPKHAWSILVGRFPRFAARMVKQHRNSMPAGVAAASGKSGARGLSSKPVFRDSRFRGEPIWERPGAGLPRGTGSIGCTIRRSLRIALDFRLWGCYLSAITYFCR
jgi:hypothetical protein